MTWVKPSDAAAEAAVWGLIETEAKKRKDTAREWLAERMGPDLLAVKALANGQDVGRASFVEGKAEYKVTNPVQFIEFVLAYFPDEVQTITAVNPAFQTALLSDVKTVDGIIIYKGQPVPGVSHVQGKSYVSVSKSKDARDKVEELLSQGRIGIDGIKALEGK